MAALRVSEWAPAGETSFDLYIERTWFDGFSLGVFGYGLQTVVAALCCSALWSLRKRQPRRSYVLLAYVSVIFVYATLGNAANMKLSEEAFVGNRDYPGGPNAYLVEQSSFLKVNLMGYVAYIMATWMQDGFLLYRFLVVFNYNWIIAIVPCTVYILSIIMSCFLLAQITGDGAELFSSSTVNFALGYWASSIATTMCLTLLIVSRLMFYRARLRRLLGSGHRNPYLAISAMLIESAVCYSVFALAFIILYAKNDPFQNVLFPILGQVQIISPELIILRVAWGKSFTDHHSIASHSTRVHGTATQVVAIQMSKLSRDHLDGTLTLHNSTDTHTEQISASLGKNGDNALEDV